jgi:pyrroloquinoline-quinone synthase
MEPTETNAPESDRAWARAQETLAAVQFGANPYLTALADGSLSLDAFRRSQEQFYYAVEFFSRPMAALVAKIPTPEQRLEVLQNVLEEHGDLQPAKFHANTFQRFLRSIGADVDQLSTLALWPEIRAFNAVLLTVCIHDQLEVGVACMGIVEHAFAGVSARIASAVVEQGWVTPDKLVHYKLHAQIDERHAAEFYRVIEPAWDDPDRRYFIQQGLELGAYIFDRLYRDLWRRTLDTPRGEAL